MQISTKDKCKLSPKVTHCWAGIFFQFSHFVRTRNESDKYYYQTEIGWYESGSKPSSHQPIGSV